MLFSKEWIISINRQKKPFSPLAMIPVTGIDLCYLIFPNIPELNFD